MARFDDRIRSSTPRINTMGVQMMTKDVFEDIMAEIDAKTLPTKYVIMCMITYTDGSEKLVTGKELDQARTQSGGIRDYKFFLDVKKIRRDIIAEVTEIYEEVNRRFAALPDA